MKNIFYFNEQLELTLLLNEQCDNNCIYFSIETDDNETYLDIVCKNQSTQQLLESGKINVIELTGDRWYNGDCTRFRLRNDKITTEWFSIKFPTTINSDMCICEQSDYEFITNGQNELDINLDEIKSFTLIYENYQDYKVENEPLRIVRIQYSVLQDTNAVFTMTLLLEAFEITDQAQIKFTFRRDLIDDTVFIPVQEIGNGKHIITLTYPIESPTINGANILEVFAEIDGGYCTITQGNLKATLTANSLMSDNSFSGQLEFREIIDEIYTLGGLTVNAFADNLNNNLDEPSAATYTQIIAPIPMGGISVNGFSEVLEVNPTTLNYLLDGTNANYDDQYVTSEMKLNTTYIYTSVEDTIDEGNMSVMQIMTTDKVEIESVVIDVE